MRSYNPFARGRGGAAANDLPGVEAEAGYEAVAGEAVSVSAGAALAAKRGATPERTLLAFALRLGVVAVVGSASPKHVLDDLGAVELAASLSPADVDGVLAAHPDRHKPDTRRGMRRGPRGKRKRSSLRGGRSD